jgi:hypothetical protein
LVFWFFVLLKAWKFFVLINDILEALGQTQAESPAGATTQPESDVEDESEDEPTYTFSRPLRKRK